MSLKEMMAALVDHFLNPATLKVRGIILYPPFKKLRSSVQPSACLSMRLYVRPSAHRFYSLLGAFLTNFLQICYESWYWEGVPGIADG